MEMKILFAQGWMTREIVLSLHPFDFYLFFLFCVLCCLSTFSYL